MKNKLLLISLILVSFMSGRLNAQDYSNWKFMHPSPHSNPINMIQIIDANTWVGVGGDGLFQKTTNAGVSWYFHNQAGIPNSAGTIGYTYALHFFDANNGIVSGDAGYIARTTDGGVHFTSVGGGMVPPNQRASRMTFVDQSVGYIGCGSGSGSSGSVVKTTDGGLTWSNIYSNNSWSVTAVCAPDKQTLYVVTMDGSVSKSTDGGSTWNTSNTVVGQSMMCTCSLDVNNILISGSGGLVYKTSDGGATWLGIQTPNSEWAYYQLKMISPTEVYAVGDPAYLWKTTDFGTTWTGVPINLTWGEFDYIEWYSIDYLGSLAIMSGNFGVVLQSSDRGLTWGSPTVEYTTQIMFDIKKLPGTNIVLAGGRQWNSGLRQILRSTDGGTNFTPINLYENTDIYALSMVSDKVGYACGTNSTVMKTTDGGILWNRMGTPGTTPYSLASMKFVNENTGWVFINYSGSDTNVFKTTNGGISWIPQVTTGTGYGIASADMADADNGYITMNSSGKPIYKTNDGGATWTPITAPFTGQLRCMKVLDKNTLYVATTSGTKRVAKSLDGGATWTTYSLPATIDVNTMDFKDVNTGYVCGNSVTAACRTTDGGNTWTVSNYHLPTGAKIYITPGDTAFATGTWGSILRNVAYASLPVELTSFTAKLVNSSILLSWNTATELNNKGFDIERGLMTSGGNINWQKLIFIQGRGNSSETSNYSFIDNKLLLNLHYYYRLKQIDYNGSYKYSKVIEVGTDYIPLGFSLAQNYPNPFNPSTNIQFNIPTDSKVKIEIFDILGNLVNTLVNENKTAGNYEINFNASGLSSGVYFYKLTAGSQILTKKMSLVK